MTRYQYREKEIACPVCQSTRATALWNVSSEQAAQHFILREKDRQRHLSLAIHIEQLWGQKTCEVAWCTECGFCYSNPFCAGDKQFYELAYERHSRAYPDWKWEFQMTWEELAKSVRPGWKLLEVGAGKGAFVKKVSQTLLSPGDILCTEFSDFGRQEIGKLGIPCRAADLEDLDRPDLKERFDAVCMFQVLEHLDEPDRVFGFLNRLLKHGGHLFVAVPNPNWIEFNELHGALLDMPPNHIARWNKAGFEKVGGRHGFHIKEFKVEDARFLSLAKQLIIYRFLRRSQQKDSIENKIQSIRRRSLLLPAQVLGIALNCLRALPVLLETTSNQGESQWVHLVKE